MVKYSNEEILEALSSVGVPIDLPEVALCDEPAPSADALERIKQRTLQKIAVAKAPSRYPGSVPFPRWLKLSAVAAIVITFIAMSWVGPAHVWASLQKAISLVPGFGLFEQEQLEFTLIAADRFRVDHQGGYIEVSGILAKSESTFVNIYFNEVPGINEMPKNKDFNPSALEVSYQERKEKIMQIYLLDQSGKEYRYHEKAGFGWAGSERDAHVSLQLPPLDENVRWVTLVIPLAAGEEAKIDVPLVSLDEIAEWGEISQTITTKGITVSAATHFKADTRVSLFILPSDSAKDIHSIGRHFGAGIPASRPVALTGDSGQNYGFQRYGQTGWQANYYELYFDEVKTAEQEVTLSIPILLFREEGKTRVTVPVSPEGPVELNKDITLGRFPLTLQRAEVVTYPHGASIRVYVDLGPAGEETLEDFTLEIRSGSWGGKYNEVTGQLKYFEVPLEGNPKELHFTLKDPVYSIAGPWIITFPQE